MAGPCPDGPGRGAQRARSGWLSVRGLSLRPAFQCLLAGPAAVRGGWVLGGALQLYLIHISEPTRLALI
eukprot:7209897-Alexandrium_andersonii.AAC.1